MATAKKKPTKRAASTSAAKPPAKPSAKPSAKTPALSAADATRLDALSEPYTRSPDASIAATAQDARALFAIATKKRAPLLLRSRLDAKVLASLPLRRALLEATERAWSRARVAALPAARRKEREEAEALRSDALAALRYFCADDDALQREVDDIRLGEGLPDLIEDLGRTAALLVEHAAHLKKADLAGGVNAAAKRATALADALGANDAETATDAASALLLSRRNRAFWHLADATRAVRNAGAYVFRRDPTTLALFRDTRANATGRSTPPGDGPPGAAPPPVAT